MVSKKEKLELVIDGDGSVEVTGIAHGDIEARRIATELGLGEIEPLNFMYTAIKAGPIAAGDREALLGKAREMGMEVREVDLLPYAPAARPAGSADPPADSTIEVLHQHSLTPSRREKAVYPLIVLAAVAVLVVVGMVIRDHFNHDYRAVPGLAEVVRLAEQPAPETGFPASIFNPSDDAYVAVSVRGWDYWSGSHAITQGFFVQMPELPVPIEQLVKGERGAASVILRFDLSRSSTDRLMVEEIWRGGMASEYTNQPMILSPVEMAEAPRSLAGGMDGTYAFDAGVVYDDPRSFEKLTRFVAVGFIVEGEDGLELATEKYRLALDPRFVPAVRTILEDFALEPEERALFEDPGVPVKNKTALYEKRIKLYVTLEETYPWTEGGRPGRRQSRQQIGLAHLDGILLGKAYVVNDGGLSRPATES